MKKTVMKLLAAVVCIVMLASSLSSCTSLFFDDEFNFTGLDSLLSLIFGNDVRKEDNAFAIYTDAAGKHHVYVNGEEINLSLNEETVELHTSVDNWFAYVYDKGDYGTSVYVVYSDGSYDYIDYVYCVLCASPIYPAIVFADVAVETLYLVSGGSRSEITGYDIEDIDAIYMYDYGVTVVYYNDNKCYMFKDNETFVIFDKGMAPVGISDNGQYVFGKYRTGADNALYVYDYISEKFEKVPDSNRFLRITDISTNGSEILLITGEDPTIVSDSIDPNDGNADSNICSYVYNTKSKETYKLGEGIYYPKDIKGNVAVFGDFKDMYFDVYDDDGSGEHPIGTAYVDKKYNSETVSDHQGEINADGDYLYYLDDTRTLWQVDLGNGKERDIKNGVESFEVTSDGDVYVLTDADDLYYIKGKNQSDEKIDEDVAYITYYAGGEVLYYELNSRKVRLADGKKTDDTEFNGLPVFTNPIGEYTYVYTYDGVGNWSVYYTDDGETMERLTQSASRVWNVSSSEE